MLSVLGTRALAGQALRRPLMVALARAIYNPRPGEAAGTIRDPAELCGLTDRAAVEAHLFDAFIPAAYRPSASSRWTAGQAEPWLEFLARHLEHAIGTPDSPGGTLTERTAGIFAGGAVIGGILLRPGPLVPAPTPSPAAGAVTTAQAEVSREQAR